MPSQLSDFVRHARVVRDFVRTPLTEDECLHRLRQGLADRERSFLDVLERGVFAKPASPYRRLFVHAGIELGDVKGLVAADGVDGAVERLHDAGVYVSKEEFRGLGPIERPGLSVPVEGADFDNPLTLPGWRVTTGGSRSIGRQVLLNAEHQERNTLYHTLFLIARQATERPEAIWRPLATRTAVNNALRSAKRGRPLARWFSQTRVTERPFAARDTALTYYARLACRLWALPLPKPEYVPFSQADRICRWLEDQARSGDPALLGASVGAAARICVVALERGIDISGTLFRTGGEPLTPARAELVARTGSEVFADYSMTELGRVGVSCGIPSATGDVHLLTDKVAVTQRSRVVEATGETVDALFYTSLLSSAPKLMINVETDDYGVREERECGCPLGELGYTQHLHGIRSYEKLTSEGVTVRGPDVIALLERTLPDRFGGAPTDYQLVEEVDERVSTLSVLVSPQVGVVDEREMVDVVLDALSGFGGPAADAAKIWRRSGTLRVVRREPYATRAGKVLPIHVSARRG